MKIRSEILGLLHANRRMDRYGDDNGGIFVTLLRMRLKGVEFRDQFLKDSVSWNYVL
jgi:hypothetical protein